MRKEIFCGGKGGLAASCLRLVLVLCLVAYLVACLGRSAVLQEHVRPHHTATASHTRRRPLAHPPLPPDDRIVVVSPSASCSMLLSFPPKTKNIYRPDTCLPCSTA